MARTQKHLTHGIKNLNSTRLVCLRDHWLSLDRKAAAISRNACTYRMILKTSVGVESGAQASPHRP